MNRPKYLRWDGDSVQRPGEEPSGTPLTYRERWLAAALLGGLLFLSGVIAFPLFLRGPHVRTITASMEIKQSALAAQMYSNDFDDHLPLATDWMDGEFPYTKSVSVFQSPAVAAPDVYGFAFRRILSDRIVAKIKDPDSTVLLFDSVDTRWNASGELNLLPEPGRYGSGDSRGNYVAFVDGHAKYLRDGSTALK